MDHFKADYVIIGAGTAGAVLANRLTKDRCHSAVVLEAGAYENDNPLIRDPLEASTLVELHFPEFFFQGKTTAQEDVNNRSFDYTNGRLLGGGSAINGLQYVEGTVGYFQRLEALLGPLWSPEEVFRRYRKIETYNGQSIVPRGTDGPLDVRQAPVNPTAMATKISEAVTAASGFPQILDYNAPPTPLGPFLRYQLTEKPDKTRSHSGNAFLGRDVIDEQGNGVRGRKLKVIFRATGIRLLFSCKDEREAIGVEYTRNGKCFKIFACKKVIICAGFRSPDMLLRAGIGPAAMLKELGIPVRFDNPNVGQDLRNHPGSIATFTANPADNGLPPNDTQALYVGGAMLPDPTPGADPNKRVIQLINISPFNGLLLIVPILDCPVSVGNIRIQSKDPLQIALGDPEYLDNPADLTTLINVFRVYIRGINDYFLANEPGYALIAPPPAILDDDVALTAYIKETLNQAHHWVGGCCMGPLEEGGVTDSTGHVHGIKNLIVADCSILPVIPDGNTAAPAFLIGWTISDVLLGKTNFKLRCHYHYSSYNKCPKDKDCDCEHDWFKQWKDHDDEYPVKRDHRKRNSKDFGIYRQTGETRFGEVPEGFPSDKRFQKGYCF